MLITHDLLLNKFTMKEKRAKKILPVVFLKSSACSGTASGNSFRRDLLEGFVIITGGVLLVLSTFQWDKKWR
jgi:hypothetical protein